VPFSLDQYEAVHERSGFLVRDGRGRIRLRGDDRKGYLQGLLSNDILALEPGTSCYAALLTPQGRMISDMRVFDVGELLLLDLERPVVQQVAEHLDMFVITEDVKVEDVTAAWSQIGLYGPEAAAVLETMKSRGMTPSFALGSSDLGIEGLDLIVPAAAVPGFLEELERAGSMRVESATMEVTRIEAGIPKFLVDMDSTTIPLEAGIEDRAISMTKGCYVGQEVIVRVLHRGGGRVAKRLVSLTVDGNAQRDDRIFAADREIGRITSAVDSPRYGKRLALGYVQRAFETAAELTVRTAAGEFRAGSV
jgi:folate-binding protein YgfZ